MKVCKFLPWLLGSFIVVLLAGPLLASAQDGGRDFSREELAQMLAPVALYPDALLSQVLMAATYPLEVVVADRWVKNNPLLRGDNLDEALHDQDWDASVKALCHVPAVLGVMSERLEDTTRLGDAFIAQEKEIMDTIQDLRARARREGNLKSDDKQRVSVGEDGSIIIESADVQTVYVPYYNTRYVYGPWWYPAWPPWYWGPDELIMGPGIYFWPDFYFGFGFGFGYWSHFDWSGRSIVIDINRRPHFFRPDDKWDSHQGSWQHAPRHRRGVVYHDRATAEHFGQPPARVERAEHQATRDKARGAVSGSAVSSAKPEGLVKSGTKVTPEPKNGGRLPPAGDVKATEKNVKPSGSAGQTGPQGVVRAERSGKVAGAPTAELSRPSQENRGWDSEARPEPTRTRELSTDNGSGSGSGGESHYDRRDSSGRDGRQLNTQERGGGGDEDRGGSGRGGRRQ